MFIFAYSQPGNLQGTLISPRCSEEQAIALGVKGKPGNGSAHQMPNIGAVH